LLSCCVASAAVATKAWRKGCDVTTTIKVADAPAHETPRETSRVSKLPNKLLRMNWTGGGFGWIWLFLVMVPIYWIVITSVKTQANYFVTNTFAPPSHPTFENYKTVIDNEIARYFLNSVIVTAGAVLPAVVISFMAAYAIIRGIGSRWLRWMNNMFLMGLAIPLQAVIIPIYLIIIRLKLYDSLLALILPSIAFAIPLSVLVLSNFIRDVPRELFESMHMDGATEWGILWRLAFPLTRPALVTVTIYNALGIWNGFLLPLVLTQSPEKRTIPLALVNFQGQFGVDVPAITASVTLTTIPIILLYAIGRRQLLSGLTAGFGK
jgi:raffinose/stachyose/melibiose transport system permease protein